MFSIHNQYTDTSYATKIQAEKEQRSVQILDNSEKGLKNIGLEQMSFEHLFESRNGGTFFQIDG